MDGPAGRDTPPRPGAGAAAGAGAGAAEPGQPAKAARGRWKLLAAAIHRAAATATEEGGDASVSVRRFSTFGLVHRTSVSAEEVQGLLRDGPAGEESVDADAAHWAGYQLPGAAPLACPHEGEASAGSHPTVYVYDRPRAVTLVEMMGFNNTGNVCIWPSEEALAHHCVADRLGDFDGCAVLELGCGKGPLAGFAIATRCAGAARVVLTDGNEQSVANVVASLPMNRPAFGATQVSARVLQWSVEADLGWLREDPFDVVVCADCFFFDEVRPDLLFVMKAALKIGGKVIAVAPSRGQTFDAFVALATGDADLKVTATEEYSAELWKRHQQALSDDPSYDPNLHYPRLLVMERLA